MRHESDCFTVHHYGGGNLDISLDTPTPAKSPTPAKRIPELPVVTAIRMQQLREDLALRSARQWLRVTPEMEYQDPAVYQAVMREKAETLAVLEKYK